MDLTLTNTIYQIHDITKATWHSVDNQLFLFLTNDLLLKTQNISQYLKISLEMIWLFLLEVTISEFI